MKSYITIIIISLVVASCTQNNKDLQRAEYSINFNDLFDREIHKIQFDSIKFVKLSSDSNSLLGNRLMIEFMQDKIFILDLDHHKSVLKFNYNGTFINRIGKFGKGPNEYLQPYDFIVFNDKVEILTKIQGLQSAVYRYSFDGKFINSQIYNYQGFSFTRDSNGRYIFYSGANKEFYDYRLYISDIKGKLLKNLLVSKKNMTIPVVEDCFSCFENNIYFRETFSNAVYKYDNLELFPHVEIDFGNLSIPEDIFDSKKQNALETISRNEFAVIKSYHENKNYCLLEIIVQKFKEDNDIILFLVNKKYKTVSKLVYNKEDFIFQQPLGISKNDEIIFLVYPIGDIVKTYSDFGYQVKKLNLKLMDNPIITFNRIQR